MASARSLCAQPGQASQEVPAESGLRFCTRRPPPSRPPPCRHDAVPPTTTQGALMERRIRRLGIFMVLCFVALFIQLNNIQVLKANSLANDPNNPRVQAVARSQTRGSILSADGVALASSVLAPKGSVYKYQRVYDPNTATLFAQIIGFDSIKYGNFRGVEAQYNSYLTPHTRPAKTLRDLLVNRTVVDNVTLTVDDQPAEPGGRGPGPARARGAGRGRRGHQPHQRAPSRPCTPIRPSTPTPGVAGPGHGDGGVERLRLPSRGAPGAVRAGQPARARHLRPGLSTRLELQGGHHLRRAREPARPGHDDLSQRSVRHPAQLRHPGPGADQLPRRGLSATARGNLEQLVIQSCDADFAQIGQLLGARHWCNQAEAYGFNQQIPLDVPRRHRGRLQLRDHRPASPTDIPGLMKSAIGQENVTASALQMAMVAGSGGQRRRGDDPPPDGPDPATPRATWWGAYQPKPWMQPISAETANTLTTFMQGVVKSGTAGRCLPGQLERGRQDRDGPDRLVRARSASSPTTG